MTQVPRLGALAVVVHDDQVLLVQRRKAPDAGLWGYPGGHVEWGETVSEAALRELREETSIEAEAGATLGTLDVIVPSETGEIVSHYLLVAVECHYRNGVPQVSEESLAVDWIPVPEVLARARPMSKRVDGVLRDVLARRAPT